jgi:hypothetical protein
VQQVKETIQKQENLKIPKKESTHHHEGSVQDADQPSQPLPSIPATLKPQTASLDFNAATGRPALATIPRQSTGAVLRFSAFPDNGQAEILVRSTLAGLDDQHSLELSWRINADGRIACITAVQTDPIILGVNRGIWSCQTPGVDKLVVTDLLDVARIITAAKKPFEKSGKFEIGSSLSIAGETFTLWANDGTTWLLVAPEEILGTPKKYPPTPNAWNDLRIQIAEDGHWESAERLISAPATLAEPGFLVRRVILRFTKQVKTSLPE